MLKAWQTEQTDEVRNSPMSNGPSLARCFLNQCADLTGVVVPGERTVKCSMACCGYCEAAHAGKTCLNVSLLIKLVIADTSNACAQPVRAGVLRDVLETLAQDLKERGELDLSECFIDGTFIVAKKGANTWERPSGAKARISWQYQIRPEGTRWFSSHPAHNECFAA